MNRLDELKNKMNKIMEENKPSVVYNSVEDQKIRDLESDLYRAQMKIPFKISLDELVPQLAEQLLGGGNFKYREYALSWQEDSTDSFRLTLTNLPHNHSKILITAPELIKKDILPLLESFLVTFHNFLAKE